MIPVGLLVVKYLTCGNDFVQSLIYFQLTKLVLYVVLDRIKR